MVQSIACIVVLHQLGLQELGTSDMLDHVLRMVKGLLLGTSQSLPCVHALCCEIDLELVQCVWRCNISLQQVPKASV